MAENLAVVGPEMKDELKIFKVRCRYFDLEGACRSPLQRTKPASAHKLCANVVLSNMYSMQQPPRLCVACCAPIIPKKQLLVFFALIMTRF